MKNINLRIIPLVILLIFVSCQEKSKTEKPEFKQSFVEHSPTAHHEIALEVIHASKTWVKDFNTGNIAACLKGYHKNAVMRAMPFGLKKGIKEISEFWTPFIQSGATNLVYTNVSVEVANETTAFLSANWSMNIGEGKIYQEKWELINNKWLLTYDEFEVVKQY